MSSLDGSSTLFTVVTARDYRADGPAIPSWPQLVTEDCWRVASTEESPWIASPMSMLPKWAHTGGSMQPLLPGRESECLE